jgi:hypothetical protein
MGAALAGTPRNAEALLEPIAAAQITIQGWPTGDEEARMESAFDITLCATGGPG